MIPKSKTLDDIPQHGWSQDIILEHGDLFVLHPFDEEPNERPCISLLHDVFFQHGNVKFGHPNDMTMGLVLRVTLHLREYDSITGKLIEKYQETVEDQGDKKVELENIERKMLSDLFSEESKFKSFLSWYHQYQLKMYRDCVERKL